MKKKINKKVKKKQRNSKDSNRHNKSMFFWKRFHALEWNLRRHSNIALCARCAARHRCFRMFEYIDDKKLDEKLTIVVLALNEKNSAKLFGTEVVFYEPK